MSGLLLMAVVVLAVIVANLGVRVKALSRRVELLEQGERALPPMPVPSPPIVAQAEPVEWAARPTPAAAGPIPEETDASAAERAFAGWSRAGFESLIGARLPVWIGAAALIAAGFFLVRYTIESGLLGPGVRSFAAGLFAALLIVASEAARRWPATASDPRIGQALAGAGIASGYGALYLAAALYKLVPPLPAFGVMLGLTALALGLALRHGPPTAVLALAGGFAAPLVAGYDAAGIAPLLVYLALFTGALFALALHRGWAWLAVAASVAGFGWINFLLAVLGEGHGAVAAFAVLLAITASAVLPRAGVASPWVRIAPLVAGLVQLLAFAPAMDFGGLAWAMYLTLAGAALALAWRDRVYVPGAVAAMLLSLALVAAGLAQPVPGASMAGAVAAAILFGGAGLALLDRDRQWSTVALGGIAGPLLIANLMEAARLADWQWAVLGLAGAGLAGWTSWRRRAAVGSHDPGLIGGALFAAILWSAATGQVAGWRWLAVLIALSVVAVALWARRRGDDGLLTLPAVGVAAMLVAGAVPLSAYLEAVLHAVAGGSLPYPLLPPLADGARLLGPLAGVGMLARVAPGLFGRFRPVVLAVAVAAALMLLWHLAKLPLGIADEAMFVRWGFVERAVISQALLVAGWWLVRRPGLRTVGISLVVLGLARIVWFDLLVLNPAFVAQQVGTVPLFNAAAVHLALAAMWCWRMADEARWRRLGMALMLAAVLAAVRQAAHGTVMTGAVTTGETYGYSAALLLLALGWLAAGIRGEARDLRLAGLVLLTGVTLKVFLVDAAALDGVLRILSFLGLGVALIGISWAYTRFLARPPRPKASVEAG